VYPLICQFHTSCTRGEKGEEKENNLRISSFVSLWATGKKIGLEKGREKGRGTLNTVFPF